MTAVSPRFGLCPRRVLFWAAVGVGVGVLLATVAPSGLLGAMGPSGAARSTAATVPAPRPSSFLSSGPATSLEEVAPIPSSVVVGVPLALSWQALGPGGVRESSFAVDCNLTVVSSANGSTVRSLVNASASGPLRRSTNGTFSVPSSAWSGGVLNLTVSVVSAVPVTVRLFGPLLPAASPALSYSVLPDLDHLVLYDPTVHHEGTGAYENDTFWLVCDRFGDPTPGAFLIVDYSTGGWLNRTYVPVTWTGNGATGAWVNYSAAGPESATVWVTDEANTTLLGPVAVSPLVSSTAAPSASSLSWLEVAAVALLAVGAIVGMLALALGGRSRPSSGTADGEEELRELAEGRETIVALVRKAGSLGLREIEAAWEPPPAPRAIADWVASLVTDGTLTATLGEGGRARFSLAERIAPGEPKVTLDEDALEREIARRDAVAEDDEDPP